MKKHIPPTAFFCALLLNALGGFAPALGEDKPSPDVVMAAVRARLPDRPFFARGDLLRADLQQLPELAGSFDADIDFGATPMKATYTLRDRFGAAVQQLVVLHHPDAPPEFSFSSPSGGPLPKGPNEPIAGTDLTWSDLMLDFLWWRGGVAAGYDRILGRECYIFDYPLAARDAPAGVAVSARLWVDVKLLALLQVEERTAAGNRARRVQVKDFKKIGGMWMIKNMEARSYPAKSRTLIRINEAGSLTDAGEIDDDAE